MSTPPRVWQADAADAQDVCDWLMALRKALITDDCSIQSGVFALFDAARFAEPGQLDAVLAEIHIAGQTAINIYREFSGLGFAAQGPRLLALSEPGIAPAARIAVQDQALGFLIAQRDIESLARHLARLIEMRLPDDSRALFRFQDPRVMSALMPLLTQDQLATLLGPVHYWIAPEIHGGFSVAFQAAPAQEQPAPFSLSAEQCALLDERLLPHSIALQVTEADASLLDGLTQGGIYDKLDQQAGRARAWGLTQNADIALFCLLSLQLPAGFEREPPFVEALARVKSEGITFDAALEAVPQPHWQALDERLVAQPQNSLTH